MRPEFSEREFEFCFNAEFIERTSDALIDIPFIPSQRVEGSCGYDVEFRLSREAICYSLFLQHKVSQYLHNINRRNQHIYNFYGGPYYFFHLEKVSISRQHELLYYLRASGEEAYYSAPLFFEKNALSKYFINRNILDNSVFIDPFNAGLIRDLDSHKISYNVNGTRAAFHSDVRDIEKIYTFKTLVEKLESKKMDEGYFSRLLSILKIGLVKVFNAELILPEKYLDLPSMYQCGYILKNYYKLRWIMFSR